MIKTVADKEELRDLLDSMNWSGVTPVVAVLPARKDAETVLVYGTDLGDEMGIEWFGDPGEEAHWCEASDDHKVYPTFALDELPDGPYTVLCAEFEPQDD